MAGVAQNGQKCLIFIVFPLLRPENFKERWKKNRKIYSKYEKYISVKMAKSLK